MTCVHDYLSLAYFFLHAEITIILKHGVSKLHEYKYCLFPYLYIYFNNLGCGIGNALLHRHPNIDKISPYLTAKD